jgi:hypothetical protein
VLELPLVWRDEQPPDPDPLAWWDLQPGVEVGLGLPSLGRVRVGRDRIEVSAPDAESRAATWARLGDWAVSQWAGAHGHWTSRGTVVVHEGRAYAITGPSGAGASLLALALAARGWSVLSDGVVVVDRHGRALAGEPGIAVDARAVQGLPQYRRRALPTGVPRVRVEAEWHDDAPLAGILVLTLSQRAAGLTLDLMAEEPAAEVLTAFTTRPELLDAPPPPPDVPCWRLRRPIVLTEPCLPAPMAARLAEKLTEGLARTAAGSPRDGTP